jgi:hypothetical protein
MFLQKAHQGLNNWWRYLLTIILVAAGIFIGQIPVTLIYYYKGLNAGISDAELAEMAETLDFSAIGIGQNWSLVLVLLAFVFGLLSLWLCVVHIHKKPFRLLITPARTINWNKILFGFALWMALAIVSEFVFYLLHPGNYSMQFQPLKFAGLLLVSLLILPLQTSFEELFFRGYALQGLSLISIWRWIPLVVTSAAFGLMHFMNPEVQAFGKGLTMAYYVGVGLFLGMLTLMDDSLELALGVHAATNIFGALFVTFDESALQTAALFHTKTVNMLGMLIAFFAAAIVFTVVVARKYHWRDWSKLYGAMNQPTFDEV